MEIQKTKEDFREYLDRIKALNHAIAMIHWDASTGAPKKGVDTRSKTLGILSGEVFALSTSEQMNHYLIALEEQKDSLDSITTALVREAKKEYEKLTKIPPKEYQTYTELCAKSTAVWEEAKEKSDFSMFAPYLEKIVYYKRKFIEYLGYEQHPYNTLLDDFEPGMTVEKLDIFFAALKEHIVPLVQKIATQGKKIETDFLTKTYSIEKQKELSLYILDLMKYDMDAGMLKESMHPFTLGFGPSDVRITTHYYPNNVLSAVFSTVHEGGHALYEQHVSSELDGTLLAEGTSMGIHESQSRFYENVLGRSLSFWQFLYPKFQSLFPEQVKNVDLQSFYEAVNQSKPSLIRIEADELTYSLHVMVRYEIEKALMEGTVEVKDLPTIWNEKYKEYLGLEPENDSEGVLQDVHWSDGMFGYFPSYALGNAYAAQFVNTMSKSIDINHLLEKGDFTPINDWLTENIHKYGKLLSPVELLKNVTGEDLNPKYFTNYLEEKFSSLYF